MQASVYHVMREMIAEIGRPNEIVVTKGLELYGGASCQYTSELREQLLYESRDFTEYDVESDPAARRRMISLTDGQRTIPVLVQDGSVLQIGWHGRGCMIEDF